MAQQVMGGILLSMQQQRTLIWTSAVTHRAQANASNISLLLLQKREHIPRVKNFFEITIPMYELDDFQGHFRLSRSSFENLARSLGQSAMFNPSRGQQANVERDLLMFLRYIGMFHIFLYQIGLQSNLLNSESLD